MSDLELLAKHCTTHHHACDCREAAHEQAIFVREEEIKRLQARIDALECCLVDVTQNAKYMGQTAARNAYFVDSAFIHKATALLEAEK